MENELISILEASRMLQVMPFYVHLLIRDGLLPCYTIAGTIKRVTLCDVLRVKFAVEALRKSAKQ